MLNDPGTLTLQVAMSQLNSAHGKDYGMVMAGALLAVIPLIVVFLIGAKQFIGDIAKGALK
ncbi:L-arabinose transport system permease protein AraQ [Clavibacter michiganensis subsp. michiganensis]|uniref:L-arabinose transport system permease protein AraQ n=1 Tax=Clavibacter michiganensis subsp. michiganensis TaxID=33013 RepID=A0A251XN47_CLAMM|nr:L-arabinose transport system permease protein AraQ [Clavibacter michiganensis subsp. michiganensis]OUE04924.1 L-arabinose transport system permease protein AraQ [Clavibacter michiganensis subsp. michiganensis]